MTFAEIISRIGAALAGWLIFIGHALTLSVLSKADCDPASDELWRGTLIFAFVTAVGLLFVGRGLPWAGSLRWVAVPAVALGMLAARTVLPAIVSTTLGAESLCSIAVPTASPAAAYAATPIERIWPVVQSGVLLAALVQALRFWRAPIPPATGR